MLSCMIDNYASFLSSECQCMSQDEYTADVKTHVSDILSRGETGLQPEEKESAESLSMHDRSSLQTDKTAKSDISFKKLWCETSQV